MAHRIMVDPDIHFSNLSRWGPGSILLDTIPPGVPADEALEAIRRFLEEFGQRPTARTWAATGMRPCEKTIRTRFGSFRAAIQAAGIDAVADG
jgi:hypothetical protein